MSDNPETLNIIDFGAYKKPSQDDTNPRIDHDAVRDFVSDAIQARDAYTAEEDRLEAELGRFFRMEEDYKAHGQIPYLFIRVTVPGKLNEAERNKWTAMRAISISSGGHLAREHPKSGSTQLKPDLSNQFWTTTIHLPIGGKEALAFISFPEIVEDLFGKLRTAETCIEDAFDMAGMQRFQIERHPAYADIFGNQGMCFEIWVSNCHANPLDSSRYINPCRYGTCRNADDVAAAMKLIETLENRTAMAKTPNVVDISSRKKKP